MPAFDAASATIGTSVSSVTTPSWTISGDNRCMVGAVMWHAPSVGSYDFSSMRWGGADGTDFTQFGTKLVHSPNNLALVTAQLIAPTVMTSTLYGELNGVVTYLIVGAANYIGVDQTTPLGTPVDAVGHSTNPSISVTINPGEWALGWLATSGGVITPGGSQNQRWGIVNHISGSSDDRIGLGPVALSWTKPPDPHNNPYIARAVALKPAAAGHLTAESGSYAITGQIADLSLSQRYLLTAESGSYGISGQEADLLLGSQQIAFNAAGSAFGTSVSTVITPSWTISGNNRCMVGALMWQDPEADNYSVDLFRWGGPSGANFYQFGPSVTHPSGHLKFTTTHLIAPTVMTSTLYGRVTGVVGYLFVGAANYTGVNQGTPLGTPVDTVSDSSTPSINVTINPGEWALGWIIAISDIVSPAGSQNQRWKVEDTVSVSGDDRTGSGSVPFYWGLSGTLPPSIARAVALKPVGRLTAESGSYVVIGQEADLSWQRSYLLTAGSGAYTSIGQVADLSWQGSSQDYLLTAGGGLYTVIGQVVDLSWQEIYPSYLLNAEPGVYMTQGGTVGFAYSSLRIVLKVLRRQPLN